MRREVVLITGRQRRHRFVAERLTSKLDLVGVVAERKAKTVRDPPADTEEAEQVIGEHFQERDEVEEELLGDTAFPDDAQVLTVPHGDSNSRPAYEWVTALEPEALLLYGSSIIEPPLLTEFEDRVINMHLGLSPYYRGSGTNFWPLVDGKPELVGTTIHLAVPDVDAGPVLTQVRPEPEPGDRAHHLGTKAIMAGVEALADVVPAYLDGSIKPVDQDTSKGKLCRRADFDAEAVREMWRNLDEDMIPRYIEHEKDRTSRYPIVDQVDDA